MLSLYGRPLGVWRRRMELICQSGGNDKAGTSAASAPLCVDGCVAQGERRHNPQSAFIRKRENPGRAGRYVEPRDYSH